MSWRRGPVHEAGTATGDGGPWTPVPVVGALMRPIGHQPLQPLPPAQGPSAEDLSLMKDLDQQYLETPFYGSRQMKAWLERQGRPVNRKRVRRLMRVMGLKAIYRRPRTGLLEPGSRPYPYLLTKTGITRPNQVWAADTTYVSMARGFLYSVAIMDWYSRYVLAWRLTNTPRSGPGAGSGGRLLRRRPGRGAGTGAPGGVQHRPGKSIHQPGVHPGPEGPRSEDQQGREGEVPRKYHDGAFVADGEI